MIVFIKLKKLKTILIIIACIAICLSGIYIWQHLKKSSPTFINDNSKNICEKEIQQIFALRNKALLEEDNVILESLYNKEVRNGLWAYEHELKKMKYFHQWSDKQSIEFNKIDSEVVIKNIKKKEDKFSINLLVSTEYQYVYKNMPETKNTFRIGTYHSLDISPYKGKWAITREWYTDPFEDSLHLDEIKNEEIKQIILSGEAKDLSNLDERRIGTVSYADKYCGAASPPKYGFKYNPEYRDYNNQGGDCTNFASQVLHEGGGFEKNYTWNYKNGAGSKAWVNAQAFHNYMLYSGRASLIASGTYDEVLKSSYNLLPGDYIAYQKKGKVAHISIVTGIDSKGYILVNSHNSDRYRVPWDLGWNNKGIKFWLVQVHF